MGIELQHTQVDTWPATIMQNDAMRVLVIPEIGGKIISLCSQFTGREWLWRNSHLELRKPSQDSFDFGAFDSGGWDEIFPTVNPCQVPNSAWGERTLTDHGELWYRSWQVLRANVDSQVVATLALAVDEPNLPFRFERTLTLAAGLAPLVASYAITNKSDLPMPYIWAAHPLLAIEPGDSFHLPEGTRTSITGNIGLNLTSKMTKFEWPQLTVMSGETLNLSHTFKPSAHFAIKLFAEDVPNGTIEIADRDKREVLRFSSNSSHLKHFGLWLNYGAWTGADTPPYYNAGIEPTNFPQDSLSATSEKLLPLLLPGFTIRWDLTVSVNPSGEFLPQVF